MWCVANMGPQETHDKNPAKKNNKCQIKPIALLNWNFQTGLTDPGEPMTTHGIPYPYIVLYHIRFSFFAVELITLLSDYPTSETTAFHMDAFFQCQVDLMNTIFTHGTWKKKTRKMGRWTKKHLSVYIWPFWQLISPFHTCKTRLATNVNQMCVDVCEKGPVHRNNCPWAVL